MSKDRQAGVGYELTLKASFSGRFRGDSAAFDSSSLSFLFSVPPGIWRLEDVRIVHANWLDVACQ